MALAPGDADALLVRARVLKAEGQTEAAYETLERAYAALVAAPARDDREAADPALLPMMAQTD